MYNLQKIEPKQWQNNPILSQYVNDLADKPYCSYIKNHCHIRTKMRAIEHVYIQPNQPARITYIVLDIDHPNGIHTALYESELPPPHLIIQNMENAHVHLVYRLSDPVYTWGKSRSAPIRYLARIEQAMVRSLGADASYGGNLMKNPISDTWFTYTTTAPIKGYSLKYLASFVDLNDIKEAANDEGFGRNCNLFDQTRVHGYSESTASYSALVNLLIPIAQSYNNRFDTPLLDNEVRHIARSIARYCTRTDFTASHKAFSELQRERVTERWGDNTSKKEQARVLLSEGVKIKVIAEQLQVNRSTLTRWGIQAKK